MTQTNNEEQLVSDEVKTHIEKLLKELCINNYTLNISEGSIRGDNYLGIIAKVVVNGKDKNNKETSLNLIVKSAPRNEGFRSFAPIREAYNREIYMYSKVFPEFSKLQQEKGILKPFKSLAKYYSSTMDNINEALIMENMKELGFQLCNRHEPLNYNHVLFVMREYGKYHALSFALRDQKPEVFKELSDHTQENFFCAMKVEDLQRSIENQGDYALEALNTINNKIACERFKAFRVKMVNLVRHVLKSEPAGQYAVIGHGDCWVNNMLFKYGNPSTPDVPMEMCFLDWQLSRLASPALDLSYFIFTCTDKELRDKHFDNLIKEYYDSLSSFLRQLGSNPDELFPFNVLQDHLRKFSVYGLYMSIMVLFYMVSDVEEIPDIHAAENIDELMKQMQFEPKHLEKYNKRISGVILDFIKYGYEF